MKNVSKTTCSNHYHAFKSYLLLIKSILFSGLIINSFFLTAQSFSEISKVLASDSEIEDRFGNSVSIYGDYAIVGAYLEDTGTNNAGAAYIFKKDASGNWLEVQKIQASDKQNGDFFGWSVSMYGNYVIVGAPQEDTGFDDKGAAYIFKKDASGNWIEEQKIQSSNGGYKERFGTSVSIYWNYAIIGAPNEIKNFELLEGSAYIFEKDFSGNWTQKQKIQASDKQNEDLFGSSVSISLNYAIVGADQEDTGGTNAGAAYIFKKNNSGNWIETQKIQASDKEEEDHFGKSVAIGGTHLIVGAYLEDTGGVGAGAAYIFKFDGSGSWIEEQKIQASDKDVYDRFGFSVSISNDYTIVGAPYEDTGGNHAGAAYVFQYDCSSGNWAEVQKIQASDKQEDDRFGFSVSINKNDAMVGAHWEDTGGDKAGAIYIFDKPCIAPTITKDIKGALKCVGENLSLSVEATGNCLTYKWYYFSSQIPGAINPTLNLYNLQLSDEGEYKCIITSGCGTSVTSQDAVIDMFADLPQITSQPISEEKCSGQSVTFSVATIGYVTHQWKKNGVNLSGGGNSTYTINDLDSNDAGAYTCEVRNACGIQLSDPALLEISNAIQITQNPSGATKCPGESVTFSVAATGGGLNYQWKKDATNISGANSSSLTINNLNTTSTGAYSCQISNICGSQTSSSAILLMDSEIPTLQNCPANITQSMDAGQCGAIVTWMAPNATDNCDANPVVSQTAGSNSGSFFPQGTETIKYTATDASGNVSSECIFDVTILSDAEEPLLSACPANITQSMDVGQCGTIVTWTAPDATDNCDANPVVNQTAGSNSGSFFPQGTETIKYTATDASSNESLECNFTVTVLPDAEKPNFNGTCASYPNAFNTDADQCYSTINFTVPNPTDNCGITELKAKIWDSNDNVVQNWTTNPDGQFAPDTYKIKWRAKDADGNKKSCTKNFTVQDAQSPDAQCVANHQIQLSGGVGSITALDIDEGSTDNCNFNLSLSKSNFDCNDRGIQTISMTATDDAGNIHQCTTDVEVKGTTLTIDDVTQIEGTGTGFSFFFFKIERAANGCTVQVDYETVNGNATLADNDYVYGSGTIYYPPGGSNIRYVICKGKKDSKPESDEDFWVEMSNPTVGVSFTKDKGEGMLLNDDAAPLIGNNSGQSTGYQNLAEKAALYPNPVARDLTISIPYSWLKLGDVRVELLDVLGRALSAFELSEDHTIVDVSVLMSGQYELVFIAKDNRRISERFVKID